MIIGTCVVCELEVDDALHSVARRIAGWERVRKGHGAASIIDRVELGPIAHTECVKQRAKLRRQGISDTQGALL